MPCYDDRMHQTTVYESGISPSDLQSQISKTKQWQDRCQWFEAALCALFNELERRDIASDVIAEASRNGLIGLMDFWNQHRQDDISRLSAELHKYSKDEQQLILKILQGTKS